MSEKLSIELTFHAESDEAREAIREAGRQHAKAWYTAALMIAGKRKPDVALTSEDFFEGRERIELAEDI